MPRLRSRSLVGNLLIPITQLPSTRKRSFCEKFLSKLSQFGLHPNELTCDVLEPPQILLKVYFIITNLTYEVSCAFRKVFDRFLFWHQLVINCGPMRCSYTSRVYSTLLKLYRILILVLFYFGFLPCRCLMLSDFIRDIRLMPIFSFDRLRSFLILRLLYLLAEICCLLAFPQLIIVGPRRNFLIRSQMSLSILSVDHFVRCRHCIDILRRFHIVTVRFLSLELLVRI